MKGSVFKVCGLWLSALFLSFIPLTPIVAESAEKITLRDRLEPNLIYLEGMSGGEIEAEEVVDTEDTATGFCNGFIDRKPNHVLILKDFFEFLKIEVDSPTDTTIVVEGPGGVWCNDDSTNADPAMEGQWQAGKYKIWIGSYLEETRNYYRIKITDEN